MNKQPGSIEQPETKTSKWLKIFTITVLVLVALGSIGYSVFVWQKNRELTSDVDVQKTTIKTLEQKLATKGSTSDVKTEGTTIAIRELGISITVPDSIKDLTYSYKSDSKKKETVSLSTKTLTDAHAPSNECTSFGTAPPFGGLSKVAGKYPVDANVQNSAGTLVKQFDSYYIAHFTSQAGCSNAETNVPIRIDEFKKALSTIKEL